MIVTITVEVTDDNWTHLSRRTVVDQEPPFNPSGRRKPIAKVRATALRDAKADLDRLLAQAIEIPDEPEPALSSEPVR